MFQVPRVVLPMTVKELIAELKKVKDKSQEVFFPQRKFIGNVTEVDVVEQTTFGFFGKDVSCVKLRAFEAGEE